MCGLGFLEKIRGDKLQWRLANLEGRYAFSVLKLGNYTPGSLGFIGINDYTCLIIVQNDHTCFKM